MDSRYPTEGIDNGKGPNDIQIGHDNDAPLQYNIWEMPLPSLERS